MAADYLVPSVYGSILAAIAAIPNDLSGQGVQNVVLASGLYTEEVLIDGFINSSATDYIIVQAAAGASHKGIFGTGARIFGFLQSNVNWGRFLNLASVADPLSSFQAGFGFSDGTDQTAENLISSASGGTVSIALAQASTSHRCTYRKCLAWNPGAPILNQGGWNVGSGITGCLYENCVSFGFDQGWRHNNSLSLFYNCVVYHTGGATDAYVTATSGGSNNASRNADCPGANPLINQTLAVLDFVDDANGNFHINVGSSLNGSGIDRSASFTDDIDLQTIDTWMRGIDFYKVGAGGKLINGTLIDNYIINGSLVS